MMDILDKLSNADMISLLPQDVISIIDKFNLKSSLYNNRNMLKDLICNLDFNSVISSGNARRILVTYCTQKQFEQIRRIQDFRLQDRLSIAEMIEKDFYDQLKYRKVLHNVFVSSSRSANLELSLNKYEGNNDIFYDLLDYQYFIKNRLADLIENNDSLAKVIVHMPTGTGKTKTTMHTIIQEYVKCKKEGSVLWLAHSTELLQQALNTFIKVWSVYGYKDINVSYNSYDRIYDRNCFYLMSYQKLVSLYKNKNDVFNSMRKNLSLIVADEAHKCLAKETRTAIDNLMVKRRGDKKKFLIGLTATPGRKFGDFLDEDENRYLANMFDKRIIKIQPHILESMLDDNYNNQEKCDIEVIKYLQERKILSKIERIELEYKLDKDEEDIIQLSKYDKNDFKSDFLRKMGQLKDRNSVIINKLLDLSKNNIPTIVFACSVEHAKYLISILNVLSVKCFGIFGDTDKKLRKRYIEEFAEGKYNIIINFDVLTTGFDSPRIKAVMITRPTKSIVLYSQMLGRGLRGIKMGGNESCLLIDLKDNIGRFKNENFAFKYFDEYWRSN